MEPRGCLEDQTRRQLTKSVLWNLYFEINNIKMRINEMRCDVSHTRWEGSFANYVQKSWEESPVMDFEAKGCVYAGTIPYAAEEYTREAMRGVRYRSKGHVRKAEG